LYFLPPFITLLLLALELVEFGAEGLLYASELSSSGLSSVFSFWV
jgi:hypothetical protein